MTIGAIIVTYQPEINNLKELISNLLSQNVKVVVVDNASKNIDEISRINNINLIKMDVNKGIATAQNIGVNKLKELGVEWFVFFDQDSQIDNNYIDTMIDDFIFISNNIDSKIIAIGPRFYHEENLYFYKVVSVNDFGFREYIDVSSLNDHCNPTIIISSGLLMRLNDIYKVGLLKDDYFIDYVDIEWCFRAKSLGYNCYVSKNVVMRHKIGDYDININGKRKAVHSAFRKYFQLRNSIWLLKEPFIPKLFAIKEIFGHIVYLLIFILLIKSERWGYLKSLTKGVFNGIIK